MAKRSHTDIEQTAMPRSNPRAKGEGDFPRQGLRKGPRTPVGGSDNPVQPRGEVRSQAGSTNMQRRRSDGGPTKIERGIDPSVRSRSGRSPSGGSQRGGSLTTANSGMMQQHASATAPGALARPGSERGSASMDARSSVPVSIQEGPNTQDRFTNLESNDSDSREDNAEIDAGIGTGRGYKGGRYRNLRY